MPFCTQCGARVNEKDLFCPNCGHTRIKQASQPPEHAQPDTTAPQFSPAEPAVQMQYAGWWRRFVAMMLDSILLLLLGSIIDFVLAKIFGPPIELTDPAFVLGFLLGAVLGILYYVVTESGSSQGTPGKCLVGLKVVDLDGNRISGTKALGRHFGKWVSSLALMAGWFFPIFTKKKQALHDIMAGTLIIRT